MISEPSHVTSGGGGGGGEVWERLKEYLYLWRHDPEMGDVWVGRWEDGGCSIISVSIPFVLNLVCTLYIPK